MLVQKLNHQIEAKWFLSLATYRGMPLIDTKPQIYIREEFGRIHLLMQMTRYVVLLVHVLSH